MDYVDHVKKYPCDLDHVIERVRLLPDIQRSLVIEKILREDHTLTPFFKRSEAKQIETKLFVTACIYNRYER